MTAISAMPMINSQIYGKLPDRYALATSMLSAPTMAPMMVLRPPSATMMTSRVPNVKLAFSGAATPPKAA